MKKTFQLLGIVFGLAVLIFAVVKVRQHPSHGNIVFEPIGKSSKTAGVSGSSGQLDPGIGFVVPVPSPSAYSSETQKKLEVLDQILSSKNDNDPRLDRDFENLSPETKAAFRQKYQSVPPEKRNERGTIVYLLGRNLSAAEDFAFLKDVVAEPPCLSLSDCSKEMKSEGSHREIGIEATLAYPQLMALRMNERYLIKNSSGNPPFVGEALSVIRAGKSSKNPTVAQQAFDLERRLGGVR